MEKARSRLYQFSVKTSQQQEVELAEFAGDVLLIVNTASYCGFTPQYKGLEALYRKYHDNGLQVLAFPCNQFGNQEPGTAEQIEHFCFAEYDVTFPVMAKIDVNGPDADPLYEYLKVYAPGILGSTNIKWNFTKFLVSRDGNNVVRFAPTTKPEALTNRIENLLKAS